MIMNNIFKKSTGIVERQVVTGWDRAWSVSTVTCHAQHLCWETDAWKSTSKQIKYYLLTFFFINNFSVIIPTSVVKCESS